MHVIESTNPKGWRWISGIFLCRPDAESELAAAESRGGTHRIVDASTNQFPLFIIENQGFEYLDHDHVVKVLDSVEPRGDEDFIHFNVYAVRQEFKPAVAGRDEMGGLLHWHIDDNALRHPRAAVLRAELAEIARKT